MVDSKLLNEHDEVFTYHQVVSIARKISNEKTRALFVGEFLTGGRVGELVRRFRRKQIVERNIKGKKFLVLERVYTEKNPKHPRRNLPLPFEQEKELIDFFIGYADKKDAEDLLFSFSRQYAWRIIRKIVLANKEVSDKKTFNSNHFMRHSRNTDLIKRYGFSNSHLKRWHGWSNEDPAKVYEHLRESDLAEKML